jgi:hypothetical protein
LTHKIRFKNQGSLARRKGYCEDFSISKYITLMISGMPEEKLRITYVRARITENGVARNQAHMALTYYPQPVSEPLISDNIARDILRGSRRWDLTPVFGVITVWHQALERKTHKPTLSLGCRTGQYEARRHLSAWGGLQLMRQFAPKVTEGQPNDSL